ncbi:MAG: hypothetical protein N3B01_11365, partial [Verrucomicrobiae bacterium]|nr:hypothetical protein [Verrucomicrobiae bacterium]
MINKLKCRLAITLFLCVVTATAAFGGWAAVKAYRSLRALVGGSAKAEKALAERYSQLGQQMDSQLRDIHSTLLQLIAEQDPATAVQFDKRCEQFRNWLSTLSSSKIISGAPLGFEYDPSAVATQAIPIFNQYEQHAKNAVRAALTTTDATGKNAVWRSLTTADENLHHLVHLAASLRARADAHLAARRVAAAPPSRELLMATALLLLALMCGWIAVTVYRTELLPLRRKLQAREILLQQQEQLAQFGKLAAGLAHEIRNPLTAINTRLFLLQRALPTDSPAHQDAHVIRGEIERLDRVVSDFLRLARPPEPRYQALSAEVAFRDVVDLLRPT